MSDFVAGNDATFAVLMFVLVTCLNLAIWFFSGAKFLYWLYLYPEFRTHQEQSWRRFIEDIKYLWKNPGVLKSGVAQARGDREFSRQLVWPWVKGYFTWRLFFLVLFFLLFTIVTYQKLTFDPYAELGLEQNADTSKVKKAYRNLSMKYHPDKDPSDEARIIYKNVRRAYKALTNREKWEEEEAQEQSVGVALPSVLTDPETRTYMMILMMCCIGMLPVWMLSKLMGKGRQSWTIWESLKKVSQYNRMLSSFYRKLGQPDCFESRYEREERVHLLKLVEELERKMPGGGLFRDADGLIAPTDLSVKDIVEYFCPTEVSSRVELRQLFLDACPQAGDSPKSPGSRAVGKGKTRQQEAVTILKEKLYVDHEIIPHVADYFRTMLPPPTEKEVQDADLYRQCVRGRMDDQKIEDPELCGLPYEAPSEEEVIAARYNLNWLLAALHGEVMRLQQSTREEGRMPLFPKLMQTVANDKLSELESVRRQAEKEAGEKRETAGVSTAMRRQLVRLFNKDTARMKMIHEVVGEIKQITRRRHKQYMEHQQQAYRNHQMMMKKQGMRR